ncbi:tetratricopeptide repeat protein [Spongiimicrobium salis]|uniref:tetratricopeptide repeat protein n=1 Tax=Spongiimicrobium salis TaxID=1667022 RepID=UPI00374CA720
MNIKFSVLFLLISLASFAQDKDNEKAKTKALKASKNITWEANQEIADNDFINAEANYRKAISKSNDNIAAPYNLGNAYYNKETYSEAFSRFKQAGELASSKEDKHKAFHNIGNIHMKNKTYEKAVEAYKQALRNNPKDEETRYNLALAKELLKKQQDENKNDDKNKDDKDKKDENKDKKEGENDENKEGDQKEEDKKDEGDEEGDKGDKGDKKEDDKKDQGNQKKPGEKDKPKDQKQQQQPRPNQLSPQQVQNLLEAMQNEEKKVQKKIDAKKVKGVKVKNEKDW